MPLPVADIRAAVDERRLVERLRELVGIPSENPPGAEKEAAARALRYCHELGLEAATYESEPGRPNIVARWKGAEGPTLTYCSHLDVVPAGDPSLWERRPFAADVDAGRVHGRGAADAKGAVAAALEAVAALRRAGAQLAGTLEFALVSDEETMGFNGAGFLVERGFSRPDLAIVGEPTSLRVVHAQRGACWFRITARGVAGHGSAPENAVSAVRHMAAITLELDGALPDIAHPVLGRPSVSVGTIHGGEKINIVPAACTIEVDRRTVPGETQESILAAVTDAIERAGRRVGAIDAVVEPMFVGAPFETPVDARIVTELASAVSDARGAPAELIGFRGASDARFFAEAGAEVVVCGPGDIAVAHTAREFVDVAELRDAAIAYALAFARLLSP